MSNSFLIRYYDVEKDTFFERPLEDMVKMLLPFHMDISFHIEALKAQATILRTNLVRKSLKLGGSGCKKYKGADLCKSDHCYDFKTFEEYKEIWGQSFKKNMKKVSKAVKETEGLVITINGKLIQAEFHHTCGGSTENAENVLKNKVVYLRKVLCDHCINSPKWENEKDFSIEDIEETLEVQFPKEDEKDTEIKGYIENVERDEEGRVKYVNVGEKKFEGKEFVDLLGLSSTRFKFFPTSIRFVSRGQGHGLGLCQEGSKILAEEGYSFLDILNYYYTGIEVAKYTLPSIEKPLCGKIFMIDPGHGGENVGFVGEGGLKEKDIALQLAIELEKQIKRLGATVYLTRDDDRDVLLLDRAKKANKIRPDFFISIHLNYLSYSQKEGCEIYYFRGDEESKKLGDIILKNLESLGVVNRRTREGKLFLLKRVMVSSLIIDIGYLSNIEEEERFIDEKYIEKLAIVISESIIEYFEN